MNNYRPLIRRQTAMTVALLAACAMHGIDTSEARLPTKKEPTWSVTRKVRRK